MNQKSLYKRISGGVFQNTYLSAKMDKLDASRILKKLKKQCENLDEEVFGKVLNIQEQKISIDDRSALKSDVTYRANVFTAEKMILLSKKGNGRAEVVFRDINGNELKKTLSSHEMKDFIQTVKGDTGEIYIDIVAADVSGGVNITIELDDDEEEEPEIDIEL
ncbi:hypothetical protein HC823_00865 [Candidatus Gracilibacteria bacterium]|nr:hypothetical protein [Candidatus Gracilibacteria bacterium]